MVAADEPTEEQRRLKHALAGYGAPQEVISRHIGIDAKTLRKHFREELDRGTVDANAKVAQSLFEMATQGNDVAAAIFWMKTRGGWREKPDPQNPGASEASKLEVRIVRLGDERDEREDGGKALLINTGIERDPSF